MLIVSQAPHTFPRQQRLPQHWLRCLHFRVGWGIREDDERRPVMNTKSITNVYVWIMLLYYLKCNFNLIFKKWLNKMSYDGFDYKLFYHKRSLFTIDFSFKKLNLFIKFDIFIVWFVRVFDTKSVVRPIIIETLWRKRKTDTI